MDKIKVYVKLDKNNVVIEINSSIFLNDISDYICIDEGIGDKYAHAQNNYLEKSLFDVNGKYNYKYVDGVLSELTDDEKVELFPESMPEPTSDDILNALLGVE